MERIFKMQIEIEIEIEIEREKECGLVIGEFWIEMSGAGCETKEGIR